jgi:hypothetical protein
MPGQNGGTLKQGNTVGVGRLKREVRLKLAKGADSGADHWVEIAEGRKCIPVYNANQTEVTHMRYPTPEERNYAIAKCCEYGLGKNDKFEFEDVTPPSRDAVVQRLREKAREHRSG